MTESEKLNQEAEMDTPMVNHLTGRSISARHIAQVDQSPESQASLLMFIQVYVALRPSAANSKLVKTMDIQRISPFKVTSKALAAISTGSAVVRQTGRIPESWKPYLSLIKFVLEIAKLFTPPHIDALIDEILSLIEIVRQENNKQ